MTTTPLPSYGIWTTDIDGRRVMGFTPEQFLSVWQARADLEAENQRLREALQVLVDNGGIGPEWMFDDARAALEARA